MLRISIELKWYNFFSEIFNQNFIPKLENFGFFQLIRNFAETTLLIDKKLMSQEAFYTA